MSVNDKTEKYTSGTPQKKESSAMSQRKGCTSRKEGFGPPRVSPLVPVQSRTGTNGGISPGSCAQGPRGPFVPVRLDLLVPVGATNRD